MLNLALRIGPDSWGRFAGTSRGDLILTIELRPNYPVKVKRAGNVGYRCEMEEGDITLFAKTRYVFLDADWKHPPF